MFDQFSLIRMFVCLFYFFNLDSIHVLALFSLVFKVTFSNTNKLY